MANNKTILMLEDDEMIAEIYQKQLEKAGFKVEVLAEGAKAAEKIKNEEPDVALLDLLIPGGGGIEILKQLQGWEGKTKKIIFSNSQDPESEQEAMSLGASAFLIKADYTPAKLLEAVNKIIQ
ncbi:MAG: response regulator [Candidatus Moraniibacteriota bacterium]